MIRQGFLKSVYIFIYLKRCRVGGFFPCVHALSATLVFPGVARGPPLLDVFIQVAE